MLAFVSWTIKACTDLEYEVHDSYAGTILVHLVPVRRKKTVRETVESNVVDSFIQGVLDVKRQQ